MFKLMACLFFAAAVAAANPYVLTVLNEVSVDPAHKFVELHGAPDNQSIDLHGWQLVTTTSACTLTHYLQYNEFVVIDSEALALGEVAHGTLRLNPLEDSITLFDSAGRVADWVCYPRYPTGHGKGPLPPIPGSIAFWNYDDFEGQSMNWYVDSTPTPGSDNDDHSSIAGTVTGTGGVTLDEACVYASGTGGCGLCGLYQQTGYTISGLGAGTYEVSAGGIYNGHVYQGVYPESVTVGYSQAVSGIDLVIPSIGVAEAPSTPTLPFVRVAGRALLVSSDGTAPVSVQIYNQVGSRVNEYYLGPVRGEKRIEFPKTLAPGIYFAVARRGACRNSVKVVLW
ncbi:hypothetical protein JXD38_05390 [candidate division WOR-3 bacterium]|nr:hypothetical protein [candidate division WOR-3 bacterium]